jgi:hypothetical protein
VPLVWNCVYDAASRFAFPGWCDTARLGMQTTEKTPCTQNRHYLLRAYLICCVSVLESGDGFRYSFAEVRKVVNAYIRPLLNLKPAVYTKPALSTVTLDFKVVRCGLLVDGVGFGFGDDFGCTSLAFPGGSQWL